MAMVAEEQNITFLFLGSFIFFAKKFSSCLLTGPKLA
jgi:hypothetical protein